MVQALGKTAWQFHAKLNILLVHHPGSMHLGIFPSGLANYTMYEMPAITHVDKLWYVNMMEYHSVLKRNAP